MPTLSASIALGQAVSLDVVGCAALDRAEVERILALELAEPAPARVVFVDCRDDAAELRSGDGLARTLPLASVPPELRPRLMALAIAELVQQPSPAPDPEPVAPQVAALVAPAPPPPSPRTPAPPSRAVLWLAPELGAAPLLSLGAGVLTRVRLRSALALAASLNASEGRATIDLGKLRVRRASLRVGLAWLHERAAFSLHLGAGVRAGVLALRGVARDDQRAAERSFRAFYAGPAAFVGAGYAFARHGFAALELELAHTLRRVRADVEGGGARTLSALHVFSTLGVGVRW